MLGPQVLTPQGWICTAGRAGHCESAHCPTRGCVLAHKLPLLGSSPYLNLKAQYIPAHWTIFCLSIYLSIYHLSISYYLSPTYLSSSNVQGVFKMFMENSQYLLFPFPQNFWSLLHCINVYVCMQNKQNDKEIHISLPESLFIRNLAK